MTPIGFVILFLLVWLNGFFAGRAYDAYRLSRRIGTPQELAEEMSRNETGGPDNALDYYPEAKVAFHFFSARL